MYYKLLDLFVLKVSFVDKMSHFLDRVTYFANGAD